MNKKLKNVSIEEIYKILAKENLTLDNWAIADKKRYIENKEKKITSVSRVSLNKHNETSIQTESKYEFYFIRYNNKYISFVWSDTEYGLLMQEPKIYAINLKPTNELKYNPKYILKLMGFKLSRKTIKDLKDFD